MMTQEKSRYYRLLVSFTLIVSGSALLLEHLFTWGGFDLTPGHEHLGLLMLLVGFLLSLKRKAKEDKQ